MDTDIEIVIKKLNNQPNNIDQNDFNFWKEPEPKPVEEDDDLSFDFGKKKKKAKPLNKLYLSEAEGRVGPRNGPTLKEPLVIESTETKDWLNDWSDMSMVRSEPIPIKTNNSFDNYQYDYLLDRLYQNFYRDRPTFKGDKPTTKIALPPPILERQGGKRIVWKNFEITCVKINRPVEHLKMFILIELLTDGSLNENGGLVLRGRYNQEAIIQLVTKYLKDFVICSICQSANTQLEKESRLTRLYCQDCYSTITVETLKPIGQLNKVTKSD